MNATAASSLYDALGGAGLLRALARRFVAEVEALPADRSLRRMLDAAVRGDYEQRLYAFLSGWLGGPPLYTQQHGLPNLRARHRHLVIGNAERDQWLHCMRLAVAATAAPDVRARLDAAFWTMANSLRNRDEPPSSSAADPQSANVAPAARRPQVAGADEPQNLPAAHVVRAPTDR